MANVPDHQLIATGGEAYGIEGGAMDEDVSLREKLKSEFFERIAKDQNIQNEFSKLDKIKNDLVAIINEEIEKRTKHKVDISKKYE